MEGKPDKPIIICHSPTRRDLKNTVEFIHAVNELKKQSKTPIELRLIENTPHKECLRLKRESHILFDHLQGYFGVSSLEGLSQGLCVIAGLDEWNRHHIKCFTGGAKLPWVIISPQEILPQLKILVSDSSYLKECAKKARDFMKTCWNNKKIVQYLIPVYAQRSAMLNLL